MYISEHYWGSLIGDTDDSLTLTAYLAQKGKKEISLQEIFSDWGRNTLSEGFRNTDPPLMYAGPGGREMDIHFAVCLAADLAALLLECKVNGCIDLLEADDTLDISPADSKICITAAPGESEQLSRILADFAASPMEYDLGRMDEEETVLEMASVCEKLRKELFL